MKIHLIILNIVLALAVIALYILHFTGIGTSSQKNNVTSPTAGAIKGSDIYYVQIDSVISNFNMAKDLSGQLETKFNSSDATLKSRQEAYQKEVNDFQYKVQRQLITRSDAENLQRQLIAKEQDLVRLQQDLTNEINEQQLVMNRQVINAIMEYMKENSAEFNYKYVLATSFGNNVLYANDSLDITQNVIAGLNEKYNKEKGQK
ncbi:MAG TPA: OmpH family outer membrane protein [Bacteroidales bacterium]|jgi:outer membrane protein|nr:OmpH family outer membrane protein [Bacteroidales bacterium]